MVTFSRKIQNWKRFLLEIACIRSAYVQWVSIYCQYYIKTHTESNHLLLKRGTFKIKDQEFQIEVNLGVIHKPRGQLRGKVSQNDHFIT